MGDLRSNTKGSKSFSGVFFINLFLSLAFSLLIFFLFIRLKSTEDSFGEYFSKVLTNFQTNFEESIYNGYIRTWFNPNLKADQQEEFRKYKLSILAKTINIFFKNILVDTQNHVVTDNLKNFLAYKKIIDLEELKAGIKKHLFLNPDLREVSTYDLDGNKIFGIKYKDTPDYVFSQEIINNLHQSKNLLLKRGEDQNLILLSTIEDASKKPFMIISQAIHKDFFERILHHLEMDNDVFYIKNSDNFVLFDNHNSQKEVKKQQSFYRIYGALTEPEEKSLKVDLNNISYSLGTIVQKNNIWGNIVAIGFFLLAFLLSFFCIDLFFGQAKKLFRWEQRESKPYPENSSQKPVVQEILVKNSPMSSYANYTDTNNFAQETIRNYQEIKPLTLEQYLLKKKKNYDQDPLDPLI